LISFILFIDGTKNIFFLHPNGLDCAALAVCALHFGDCFPRASHSRHRWGKVRELQKGDSQIPSGREDRSGI